MPSNAELRTAAKELAGQLEIEVNTKGLKNDELQDLVSDLRAKVKDAEHDTQADAWLPGPDAPAELTPAPRGYFVAEGKSVTSRKGLLDAGDEIKPEFLKGGAAAFDKLLKIGVVVEK